MIHRLFLKQIEFNMYENNTLYDFSIRGTLWEMYAQLCNRHGHYDMLGNWHTLLTPDGCNEYTFDLFRKDCELENIRFSFHLPNAYETLITCETYHIESFDVCDTRFYALSEY